jgi:type I restriction enzyme, S subunit
MNVKPGYKQTEVGVIPEEWEAKSLRAVLSKGRLGGNYANQDAEAELPLMKMGNLARGYFDLSKVQFITPGVTPELPHRLVYGDVLFNTRNTLDLVGKVAIWRDELPVAYYNSNLMRLEFDPEQVCSHEYANYALNTEGAVSRLRALATGTTSVAAIYTRDLMKLQVLVPPLPEQRAIATALSDVDGLLGGLDRLIAKKRDLKQAAMQQLLTGQTRLPGFYGEWEAKRFGDIAVPRRDRVDPKRTGTHEFCVELEHIASESGVLLGSTRTGEQASLKSVFRLGDVLFGKLRAYLRKYWMATRAGVCSTEIWVFAPKDSNVTTAFLYQIIKTDGFIEAASNAYGTHMPRSDWNIVKNYELKIPLVPEQTAIAEVLTDMDAELAALEQRREKTRALKQAMMQELLTGRTRLV